MGSLYQRRSRKLENSRESELDAMCNCKQKHQETMDEMPVQKAGQAETAAAVEDAGGRIVEPDEVAAKRLAAPYPIRSGACPFCLRKHVLKAAGYAEEVAEDPTREWEREQLLKNLLLAEDHAAALGDAGFKAAIREERLKAERGEAPDIAPLLARAREKILELERVAGVEKAQTEAY